MKKIPDKIYVWISKALLGEITSNIRGVAVQFSESFVLTLRFYVDENVDDEFIENVDCIVSEIYANTSSDYDIKEIIDEYIVDNSLQRNLESLDGFVYLRKE